MGVRRVTAGPTRPFACCLFEALTRKKVFEGETVTDIIAAVVKNEPGWERLPETTPRAIAHLLKRCLEKNPRERLRDIGEARIALGKTSSEPEPPSADAVAPTGRSSLLTARSVLTGLLVAALLGVIGGITYGSISLHFDFASSAFRSGPP